jgi:selenide, water dikinase
LWHNLRAVLSNQPLKVYEPQPQTTSFLTCGDGTTVLDYKGWAMRSRWVTWLKGWRDRSFVRQFR